MCTNAFTQLDPRDEITTGSKRPTEQMNPLTLGSKDVPLGRGLAGEARSALLSRRERLRIAEEG